MEKKIDELESKRTELCNRMNEVTKEFNKLNKEQRCNRMYAMQRFPALDSLSSEEEKKNRTNEMKIYVEKLQKDILEINLIIEEIEAAIESVNKPDQVIDLEIGGKPFEYHGWDNGGR
jgi:prefoldin subunit 5